MKKKSVLLSLIIFFFSSGIMNGLTAASRIKALIITGQNNHNWKSSSVILKKILEDSKLFTVQIAVSPGNGQDMERFNPDLSFQKVAIVDYNGDSWNRNFRTAFVTYVKNGGGLVIYHAADNAFPDWKEYNEICGLGGWNRRDEAAGPYLYWEKGKIKLDNTPGIGGYHGARHPFLVINRDRAHPITKGLPLRWMHARDELYSLLRGPARNLRVLATAYSSPLQGGTGRHEPVLFTVSYGKGRIFHTVLGHTGNEKIHPSLDCVGFIVTFLRGTEWAATGQVTQDIPGDFPGTDSSTSAPEDVRRWPGYTAPDLDKILARLASYDFGCSDSILIQLKAYIRSIEHSPGLLRICEKKMLKFLQAGNSFAAKQFICRQLGMIGTRASVSRLSGMTKVKTTSDIARYALEKIPGKEADRALQKLLRKTSGKIRIGVINSLGQRGDPSSLAALKDLLTGCNLTTAEAVIHALGLIRGSQAVKIIRSNLGKWQGKLDSVLENALLKCAESFQSQNRTSESIHIYKSLLDRGSIPPVRLAALKGLFLAKPEAERGNLIIDILKNGDKSEFIKEGAASLVSDNLDLSSLKTLSSLLPVLSSEIQVKLISALASEKNPAILEMIKKSAFHQDINVRVAALKAIGKLGGASAVYFLVRKAASSSGGEQKTARQSLYRLKGDQVDPAIITLLIAQKDPGIQGEIMTSIRERRIYSARHLVMTRALHSNRENRLLAIRALKTICKTGDIPKLIQILGSIKSDGDRTQMAGVIAGLCSNAPNPQMYIRLIMKKLSEPEKGDHYGSLLKILGNIGYEPALPMIRRLLGSVKAEQVDTAVRILSRWPNLSARHDLLKIARQTSNLRHHVLALQGYIRLLKLDLYCPEEVALGNFKVVLQTARRLEEKKNLLGILPLFASSKTLGLASSCLHITGLEDEAKMAVKKIKSILREKK